MFLTKQLSRRGKYKVRLYDSKEKKFIVVTVDDFIPCHEDGSPCFSRPNGNELWVIILEKVYAKYVGGGDYGALKGGFKGKRKDHMAGMGKAVIAFTGGSSVTLVRREGSAIWEGYNHLHVKKQISESEELFRIVLAHVNAGALVCAGTCSLGDDQVDARGGSAGKSLGIIGNHAYSILEAKDVKLSFFGGKRVFLFQLRNPWGSGEWQGAWSDKAPEWTQHPSIAKEVGKQDVDDGRFFMAIEDFVKYYDVITIVEYSQGIDSLALDTMEGSTCGTVRGCVCGCLSYWCLCNGLRALYFSPKHVEGDFRPAQKSSGFCCC